MLIYPKPTVYLIEADPGAQERVAAALAGFAKAVVTFDCTLAFLSERQVEEYACVIVELEPPDMGVLDFVATAGRILPVIVVGRTEDLEVAVDIMRAGAANFLDRPCDGRRLRAAVRAATKALLPDDS
ncbi:MAG: response regulator [Variovorax sp.]|nr:MAG: response regulator [Variovorax sp.]